MKNLISAFIANDLQIDQFNIEIGKSRINLSLSEGITLKDIKRMEKEFNLDFLSVVPLKKFSGASWISLYFNLK